MFLPPPNTMFSTTATFDQSIMELEKSFMIADAHLILLLSLLCNKPKRQLHAYWKVVKGFPTVDGEIKLLKIANGVGGESFSSLIKEDLEQHPKEQKCLLMDDYREELSKFLTEEKETEKAEVILHCGHWRRLQQFFMSSGFTWI